MKYTYLINDLSRVRTIMGTLNDLMDTIRLNPSCPEIAAKMEMLTGFDYLDSGSTALLTEAVKLERMERYKDA